MRPCNAIDGAAQMAGISGKPEIKEYGKMTPWGMLFGGNDQFSLLERMLLKQVKNEVPITAPLAMPEQWQVQ